MVGIVTALHAEARPLIDFFQLKKDVSSAKLEIFTNGRLSLIISGIGKIKSAIATTCLTQKRNDLAGLINIGICGARPSFRTVGELIAINKITDQASAREFFPDIILKHNLPEGSLTTFDTPVTTDQAAWLNSDLVDMEASGFFQAASTFLPPHQIAALKIISDFLEIESITREWVAELIRHQLPAIETFVGSFASQQTKEPFFSKDEAQLLQQLKDRLRLTATQGFQLDEWAAAYKVYSKKNISILNEFLHADIRNKNERQAVLGRIRERLDVA